MARENIFYHLRAEQRGCVRGIAVRLLFGFASLLFVKLKQSTNYEMTMPSRLRELKIVWLEIYKHSSFALAQVCSLRWWNFVQRYLFIHYAESLSFLNYTFVNRPKVFVDHSVIKYGVKKRVGQEHKRCNGGRKHLIQIDCLPHLLE